MKKISIFAFLLLLVGLGQAYAQDQTNQSNTNSMGIEEIHGTQQGSSTTVNFDRDRLLSRMDALERRVSDLERDIRYQDDRIRTLDRSMDDLERLLRQRSR